MIKVKYEIDNCGHLRMYPINKRLNKKIKKYLETWDIFWSGYVLVERSQHINCILSHMTKFEHTELRGGWSIIKKVDPWLWLHNVGWDAQEGIII